jgi:hypothetical protein
VSFLSRLQRGKNDGEGKKCGVPVAESREEYQEDSEHESTKKLPQWHSRYGPRRSCQVPPQGFISMKDIREISVSPGSGISMV